MEARGEPVTEYGYEIPKGKDSILPSFSKNEFHSPLGRWHQQFHQFLVLWPKERAKDRKSVRAVLSSLYAKSPYLSFSSGIGNSKPINIHSFKPFHFNEIVFIWLQALFLNAFGSSSSGSICSIAIGGMNSCQRKEESLASEALRALFLASGPSSTRIEERKSSRTAPSRAKREERSDGRSLS